MSERYDVLRSFDAKLIRSRLNKDEALKAAQAAANHEQEWMELREHERGDFVVNVNPEHQCKHCGRWS